MKPQLCETLSSSYNLCCSFLYLIIMTQPWALVKALRLNFIRGSSMSRPNITLTSLAPKGFFPSSNSCQGYWGSGRKITSNSAAKSPVSSYPEYIHLGHIRCSYCKKYDDLTTIPKSKLPTKQTKTFLCPERQNFQHCPTCGAWSSVKNNGMGNEHRCHA